MTEDRHKRDVLRATVAASLGMDPAELAPVPDGVIEAIAVHFPWPDPAEHPGEELLHLFGDRVAVLLRLAHTDPLTGLPNRRAVEDRLGDVMSRCARCRCQLGIILLDVDNLKAVNDRRGHLAGDQLLCEV